MRFLEWSKDGGPESPVDGFFIIEIKKLFSIVILHFNPGMRESYHNHAFNALTLWLKGIVREETKDDGCKLWESWQLKYTPRKLFHRIYTAYGAWALSFRGPWQDTWQEYIPEQDRIITLTHSRKVVDAC